MKPELNVIHNDARKIIAEMSSDELPEFMFIKIDSKGKEKIVLSPASLLHYCQKIGFHRHGKHLIRLCNGVAELVDNQTVFQYCLEYVRSFGKNDLTSVFLTSGESLLIKNKGILLGLSVCPLNPVRDMKNKAYLYYRNSAVLIDDDIGVQLIGYDELDGFVWKEDIKDRDFEILPQVEIDNCQYYRFIQNTSNDTEHCKSTITGIGYLLHGHKDPTIPKAVIINDENLEDNGKPEGGTGKGVHLQAYGKMIQITPYNGKNSEFGKNRFAYQAVTPSTRAILIDDAKKNFPLEDLFSVITDTLIVERKNKGIETLDYKVSPKFVITTNYTIRGRSSSYNRRRFDIYLNGHYSYKHRPIDDFGCEFFHGWDEMEWKRFDLFMATCIVQYLAIGLVEHRSEELEVKMLKHETSAQFWETMENEFNRTGERFPQWKIKESVVNAHPGKWVEQNIDTMLAEWIKLYANHKGYKIKKGNYNGIYYEFTA